MRSPQGDGGDNTARAGGWTCAMRRLFTATVAVMLLATSVAALSGFAQQGDERSSEADHMPLESGQLCRVAILLQGLGSDTDRAFCTWYDLEAVLATMGVYDDIVKFSYKAPGESYSAWGVPQKVTEDCVLTINN